MVLVVSSSLLLLLSFFSSLIVVFNSGENLDPHYGPKYSPTILLVVEIPCIFLQMLGLLLLSLLIGFHVKLKAKGISTYEYLNSSKKENRKKSK